MNSLGTPTPQQAIYKAENHKLHQQFDAMGLTQSLTFSAALVTLNSVSGSVGPYNWGPVVFDATSDNTMQLIADAIRALPNVKAVEVVLVTSTSSDDRTILITPIDQVNPPTVAATVTLGASQATAAVTNADNTIKKGMPVELDPLTGKLKRVTTATANLTMIGIAVNDAQGAEKATVMCLGAAITTGQAKEAMSAGPVKWDSFDTVTNRNVYTQVSVTATNMAGWVTAPEDTVGEEIQIILRS